MPEDNFAVNGDVESGLNHWGTTSGTISRATNQAYGGGASAYISGRTASWHGLTFDVGALTEGNEYEVAVWVRLASGAPDSVLKLTAKRLDDGDSETYKEYSAVAMVTASASEWTLIEGYYTQSGTPFQHFIIESDDDSVSFYADNFSVAGYVDPVTGPVTGGSFFVGNITTGGSVRSDFVQYWNQITPENEGKWGSVERNRDSYNWSALDSVYNYAKRNNIPFKQHTFVWGSQAPGWIGGLSPNEQAAEIEEWIRDYCARYPDTELIDVVNEATPGHAPATFARSAFGENWIIKSFQLARQYCPNAILILNDYNVLSWNTDEFMAMARPAVEAGVVDAIGLQSHGLEDWTVSQLRSKLDRIASFGLPIYISEYDIAETNDARQLSIMQAQFPLFYNHPSVVGITIWGYVVGKTWRDGTGLIREDGSHRPAMTWLLQYLRDNPKTPDLAETRCDLPTSFTWESSAPLIAPQNSQWASIKDPTIVEHEGKYHMFATVFNTASRSWGGVYLNFTDWDEAANATQVDMTQTLAGATVAPQVFFFEPHNTWYLIYQWGAKYSTNDDISDPYGWSTPSSLLQGGPNNGIDYWVICDTGYCYLFFSGDDGNLYRSKVAMNDFPRFTNYEIVMSDTTANLFEAANVYKIKNKNEYLLLVEAYAPRYFRSWTSSSLDGPWTPLADTRSNPFAGEANVFFPEGKWTSDISHGEMIRSNSNQTLTIDPCNLAYVYQGQDPNANVSEYSLMPYRLGLLQAQ